MFSSDSFDIQNTLAKFGINVSLDISKQVRHLVNDSRELTAGDIFCAVNGTAQKGREFITQALTKNCHVILVECDSKEQHGQHVIEQNDNQENVAVIEFYELNKTLFSLAETFYQSPQSKMNIIGITGTNGKTSTSQMLAQLLDSCGKPCSVIGTNGFGKVNALSPLNNTTPGATELHKLLESFANEQQSTVAMEVSSHALEQKRVLNTLFDTAIFTNLSRDHLDYHQTMENYAEAKFKIFSQSSCQIAIVNGDDVIGKQWISDWKQLDTLIVYGRSKGITHNSSFVHASNIEHLPSATRFTLTTHLESKIIESPLIGDFNIDNLLAAISVLVSQKLSIDVIAQAVSTLTPVMGRMEVFEKLDMPLTIVDYAHTPDGLKNALLACRQHCKGAVWVVFGCGGDRDKGKRPLMGKVAEMQSDHVIVTNDNPRTENAETIAKEILEGCEKPEKISVMLERQKAVITTLKQAKKDDVVLLAGKGHEDYILMGNQRTHYNERELVRSIYAHGATS